MKKNQKLLIVAGAVAVLLLVAVFVVLRQTGESGAPQSGGPRDIFSEPGQGESFPDTKEGRVAGARKLLEDYRKWSVYPPNSRPLLRDHEDLIEYQIIKTRPQALLFVDPVAQKPTASAYQCLLQPAKHTVVGEEPQVVTFWCNRAPDGAFVPIEITEVVLQKRTPAGVKRLPTPNMNDRGEDGDRKAKDNVHTLTWKPSRQDWGEMDLTIKLKIPDEKEGREYELSTSFFSTPRLVAEYTGQSRDRIADGSLVISAEVNVIVPGYYELVANLFGENDEPVAISRTKLDLKAGKQWVDFLFFGRVLRDRGVESPFVLKGLRGERKNLAVLPSELAGKSPEEMERLMQASLNRPAANQPNREVMPPSDKQLRTARYRLSEFSNRAYDSPDKKERLKLYEEQLRDAETGN